jgi:pyruvate ferredoxin oxidoreductase alpha subunit
VQPAFRASRPAAHGVAVLEAAQFSFFRYQLHHAMQAAVQVHAEAAQDFERIFGRRYDVIDPYRMDDAEHVLVMAGSFATKGRASVDRWRAQGRRVGLLRLRMIRPRPTEALVTSLTHRKGIAVLDQNLSPGLGGILFQEVAAALAASVNHPAHLPQLRSFVGGLGGKEISEAEFDHLLSRLTESSDHSLDARLESRHPQADPTVVFGRAGETVNHGTERAEPELLMTEREWAMIGNRLAIAGKSLPEVTS